MDQDELARTVERLAAQGHVASGVGHHVINAFSAIVSNAEILRLTANTPMAADPAAVAEMIVRTAVDASAVARRLIDFTRLATAVGPARLALDRLLGDVIEAERRGGRPEVTWVVELATIPPIVGHDLQLMAMMHRLFDNAYEAMPASGGTISVRTSLDDRGWIVLDVADTGRGMEPKVLERAIEPFFTTKPGHFGVGLSIANGIWRRHHGTLALRSEPDGGTTVRLCAEPAMEGVAAPTKGS
jgi:signal transduction histidine kinase